MAENKRKKDSRIGESRVNSQGYLMTVVDYINANNIIVQFQDEFRAKVLTTWHHFANRQTIENPYHPSVYGVGIVGSKYPVITKSGAKTKEYEIWKRMLGRCFDNKFKQRCHTYQNVTCAPEWLLFENFYEWLHSQENFNNWLHGSKWAIDKDILVKGNNVYSPSTCCLVPNSVNLLFCKANAIRGKFPIGVSYDERRKLYRARLSHPIMKSSDYFIGYYTTPESAFEAYKTAKENVIKQVATIEFSKGNIIENCYIAMQNYTVEIND